MLSGKKIIVGVSGSIAAYKAAFLVRLLAKAGAEVRVVTTEAANKFVTDLTFSNLSKNAVFTGLWDGTWTEHVHWGNWADLFVVAPATANTMAKMANGICDNALMAVYLSAKCPIMIAPAMDADMYKHQKTRKNLATLRNDGLIIVEGEEGEHASGLMGPGRFAEPEAIFERVEQHFSTGPLSGKKILITAGPTEEAIDPVRFISNHSSGKMGYALANEAKALGAEVILVSGPVEKGLEYSGKTIHVRSAAEMYEAVMQHEKDQDILIMAAAVADYAPTKEAVEKIKKSDASLQIEFQKTKDILKTVGANKQDHQFLVGFALETNDGEKYAREKLISKNLDLIVLNSLADEGAGFGHSTNKIAILDNREGIERYELKSKSEVAKDILARIVKEIKNA